MANVLFELDVAEHPLSYAPEGMGYPLPEGRENDLLLRFGLKDGAVVDRFPGKPDVEVLAEIKRVDDERREAAEVALEEKQRAAAAELSTLDYLRRFTQAERIAIASSDDLVVKDFMRLVDAAQFVSIIDPDTVVGTRFLEAKGLLADGRADEILAV